MIRARKAKARAAEGRQWAERSWYSQSRISWFELGTFLDKQGEVGVGGHISLRIDVGDKREKSSEGGGAGYKLTLSAWRAALPPGSASRRVWMEPWHRDTTECIRPSICRRTASRTVLTGPARCVT